LELIIVILLGITALFTAWASWIGDLHGGNQASNYSLSNNKASEANSEYNVGVQRMMMDMLTANDIDDLMIDYTYAAEAGDEAEMERLDWKVSQLILSNGTPGFEDAYYWALEYNETSSEEEPVVTFLDMPDVVIDGETYPTFYDSYLAGYDILIAESDAAAEQGTKDNEHGDAFGLVTVIYSVVLFLLGIVSSFKNQKNKLAVVAISFAAFFIATIYMFTLPLPTGFDLVAYFS
jgi:hypothetical protein